MTESNLNRATVIRHLVALMPVSDDVKDQSGSKLTNHKTLAFLDINEHLVSRSLFKISFAHNLFILNQNGGF